MSKAFDRDLDDVVKENIDAKRAQRHKTRDLRAGVSGYQPHRFTGRDNYRPVSKFRQDEKLNTNKYISKVQDYFREERADELTKILISNLDFGVSLNDVRDLFTEFGRAKRMVVNYDKSGRSLGTAEIIYEKRISAMKAMQKYNGVPLDGKAMVIEVVDKTASFQGMRSRPVVGARPTGFPGQKRRPRPLPPIDNRDYSTVQKTPQFQNQTNRTPGKFKKPEVKEADLDDQMDAYLASKPAKQTAEPEEET